MHMNGPPHDTLWLYPEDKGCGLISMCLRVGEDRLSWNSSPCVLRGSVLFGIQAFFSWLYGRWGRPRTQDHAFIFHRDTCIRRIISRHGRHEVRHASTRNALWAASAHTLFIGTNQKGEDPAPATKKNPAIMVGFFIGLWLTVLTAQLWFPNFP